MRRLASVTIVVLVAVLIVLLLVMIGARGDASRLLRGQRMAGGGVSVDGGNGGYVAHISDSVGHSYERCIGM